MKNHHIVDDSPLTTPSRLLAAYANLLARSTRMLTWVKEHDWFNLVEEQTCYAIEVESIAAAEVNITLSDDERRRKLLLLEQIVEQDLEIRRRLRERQGELRQLIGTHQRKRNLSRSYGVVIPLETDYR
ncbi:flagellar protein FliT [Microbulbifer harenosus]|uniref:Flagellar protein FliT n=1 Tax=Microbulbifer harenosus TaxID=2576840 RepID=A0ABY2UNC7_9GAMM|nr:flagellar protein FliT [Microbulbifer harenosus]TLM79985.1 flagellar protein FliT [Microbulbifer harenosus]